MGVFDTIGGIFGLNLESRIRKAVFIVMTLVVVVVVMSAIDPIIDKFLTTLLGTPVDAPFTIGQIMDEIIAIWEPMAPILGYIRDSTLYSVFFVLGMFLNVLAIVFDEKVGFGARLKSLGTYFNDQRDEFGGGGSSGDSGGGGDGSGGGDVIQ